MTPFAAFFLMLLFGSLAAKVARDFVYFVPVGFQNSLGFHFGRPWPFPYHAIVPQSNSITNLLVPWCVSASHSAYGNTRLEVEGMILGQAAGCAAGLAIESNCAVQNVNIPNLQTNLVYNYGQKITYP